MELSDQDRDRLPAGFAGLVSSRHEIEPTDACTVRLPGDGEADGPFLRLPEGPYDAVVVDAATESMGRCAAFVQAWADRLRPGGAFLVDVANLQDPRWARRSLEGRSTSLDPYGSLRDPERALLPREVVEALDGAGLLVRDLIAVPARPDAVRPEFARTMLREGFLAAAYVDGPPPIRLWLRGAKQELAAGSVLVGAGDDRDILRTASAAREFLPDDWEVVVCPGDGEVESFNRGVASSRGELLWFLRAGALPSAALFDELVTGAVVRPALPCGEATRGDLSGLMAMRTDVLVAGPISYAWHNDQVAYEDFGMRLEALGRGPLQVETELPGPGVADADPTTIGAEAQRLLTRWEDLLSALDVAPLADREDEAPEPPWGDRPPRVSLCMIARDEERYLEGCLRSVRGAVDEIVLVDTGSADRTVEIAENHGARVLHRAWDDDFSAPRNHGIAAATGDWILVLDADERLVEGGAERLRELVADPRMSGYHIVMRNVFEDGKTQGVRMVRLFRNLPGARFENVIHEQISPSLTARGAEQGLILGVSDIVIEHVGYTNQMMQERGKNERNDRLFRKQLERHPRDIYSLYKYGDFLRRVPGRNAESIEVLQQALAQIAEQPPGAQASLPYASEIAALCALEQARSERERDAERIVEHALRAFMPTPNLHYIAAGLALAAGRNDEAVAHYRRCLACAGQVLVVPIQEGITSWVSLCGIAQAWLQKGQRQRAARLLRLVRRMAPSYDVAALTLSRMHFEQGDGLAALEVLTEYLAEYPESAGACQQATVILGRLGMTEQARQMGQRAIELLESASLEIEAKRMRETVAALA